mgnify:CR=1 FL=1
MTISRRGKFIVLAGFTIIAVLLVTLMFERSTEKSKNALEDRSQSVSNASIERRDVIGTSSDQQVTETYNELGIDVEEIRPEDDVAVSAQEREFSDRATNLTIDEIVAARAEERLRNQGDEE